MFGQMVGSHESFGANGACETFFTGMGSEVTLKFIGSGEAFAAEEPITDKGTFAGVPTEMGLQVGGLTVDFVTTWIVTDMHLEQQINY